METDTPQVKSITPSSQHFPEGDVQIFTCNVIHRTDEMVVLKWENPFKNKVWIEAINLTHKIAIVTEYYTGLTSFGVNVETLDCR